LCESFSNIIFAPNASNKTPIWPHAFNEWSYLTGNYSPAHFQIHGYFLHRTKRSNIPIPLCTCSPHSVFYSLYVTGFAKHLIAVCVLQIHPALFISGSLAVVCISRLTSMMPTVYEYIISGSLLSPTRLYVNTDKDLFFTHNWREILVIYDLRDSHFINFVKRQMKILSL
jgi:hypothetical protein